MELSAFNPSCLTKPSILTVGLVPVRALEHHYAYLSAQLQTSRPGDINLWLYQEVSAQRLRETLLGCAICEIPGANVDLVIRRKKS